MSGAEGLPRPEDYSFAYELQVRLPDFDFQGHVNNATYLTYAEAARVAYAQEVMGQPAREGGWVLAEVRCRYLAPIPRTEDRVIVYQRLLRMGRTSLVYAWAVYTGSDARRAAEGEAVQVYVDTETERPRALPEIWRKRIEAYEAAHSRPVG